jgi:hypothetical protein
MHGLGFTTRKYNHRATYTHFSIQICDFNGSIKDFRSAYQPPASSTFLSEQISHQQPASSTFLSEQTSTSHQPPAKRTGCCSGKKNEVAYLVQLFISYNRDLPLTKFTIDYEIK